MITPDQLGALINYLIQQLIVTIEKTDINKDDKRLLLGIDDMFKELNIAISDHIPQSLYMQYKQGIANVEDELKGLGISIKVGNTDDVMRSSKHNEAIVNIITDTMADLRAATRTAKDNANMNLNKALDDVRTEIANGLITGATTKQISKRVAEKFADENMTAFVTKDGKHLPLDFYAKTVTRTKMTTAYNHGTLNRYEDRKVKHVMVTGNVPTCGECARYRGIVFATSRGDEFPYIDLHRKFPLHPNCQCNFRPWIKKFKSKHEIDKAKRNAENFNPNKDNRSAKEKNKYDNEQKAKAKARKERLSYNRMVSKLGNKGPKSFKEYQKAKKDNKELYHKWVASMKGIEKTVKEREDKEVVKPVNVGKISVGKPTSDKKDVVGYSKDIFDNASEQDREDFKRYTEDDYSIINEHLRDKRAGKQSIAESHEELKPLIDAADRMQRFMDKAAIPEDITTYRGITEKEVDAIIDNADIINGVHIGRLESFKSTSLDESVGLNFSESGWLVKYDIKEGASALSLNSVSSLEDEEQEVLLNNGLQYMITDYDEDMRIITLAIH